MKTLRMYLLLFVLLITTPVFSQDQFLTQLHEKDIKKIVRLLEAYKNDNNVLLENDERASFIDPYTGGGCFMLLVIFGICVFPVANTYCLPTLNELCTRLGDECYHAVGDIENQN